VRGGGQTEYQYWLEEYNSSEKEIHICIIYFCNDSLAKEQFNVTYQKDVKPASLDWSGLNYEDINGTAFYFAQYGDPVSYFGVCATTQNNNYIITMNFFRFHLSYNPTNGGISLDEIAELINAIELST